MRLQSSLFCLIENLICLCKKVNKIKNTLLSPIQYSYFYVDCVHLSVPELGVLECRDHFPIHSADTYLS